MTDGAGTSCSSTSTTRSPACPSRCAGCGFQRVALDPDASRTVEFRVDSDDIGFYDNGGTYVVEPGLIELYAGDDSTVTLEETFRITR